VFSVAELEGPLFRWIRELGEGATESAAHDRFAEAAPTIEAALDHHDWLLKSHFTLADVMCASVLQGAQYRDLLRPWAGLEAYVQRSEARPAYARAAAISDRPRT
jgi:glutathione S-transferase